jgi:hypothetical protein
MTTQPPLNSRTSYFERRVVVAMELLVWVVVAAPGTHVVPARRG